MIDGSYMTYQNCYKCNHRFIRHGFKNEKCPYCGCDLSKEDEIILNKRLIDIGFNKMILLSFKITMEYGREVIDIKTKPIPNNNIFLKIKKFFNKNEKYCYQYGKFIAIKIGDGHTTLFFNNKFVANLFNEQIWNKFMDPYKDENEKYIKQLNREEKIKSII